MPEKENAYLPLGSCQRGGMGSCRGSSPTEVVTSRSCQGFMSDQNCQVTAFQVSQIWASTYLFFIGIDLPQFCLLTCPFFHTFCIHLLISLSPHLFLFSSFPQNEPECMISSCIIFQNRISCFFNHQFHFRFWNAMQNFSECIPCWIVFF